jgi:hypothetical protein
MNVLRQVFHVTRLAVGENFQFVMRLRVLRINALDASWNGTSSAVVGQSLISMLRA